MFALCQFGMAVLNEVEWFSRTGTRRWTGNAQ
jgi:hypothetical protein